MSIINEGESNISQGAGKAHADRGNGTLGLSDIYDSTNSPEGFGGEPPESRARLADRLTFTDLGTIELQKLFAKATSMIYKVGPELLAKVPKDHDIGFHVDCIRNVADTITGVLGDVLGYYGDPEIGLKEAWLLDAQEQLMPLLYGRLQSGAEEPISPYMLYERIYANWWDDYKLNTARNHYEKDAMELLKEFFINLEYQWRYVTGGGNLDEYPAAKVSAFCFTIGASQQGGIILLPAMVMSKLPGTSISMLDISSGELDRIMDEIKREHEKYGLIHGDLADRNIIRVELPAEEDGEVRYAYKVVDLGLASFTN